MPSHTLNFPKDLSLPPAFRLKTLREGVDAFSHACAHASEGAGTLFWARRFHLADFAIVLEPEKPLSEARLAFYAAMNALADALSVGCLPEKPILFNWPDAITIDGGLVGGGRLGWPAGADEAAPPEWLVFGAMIRLATKSGEEIGNWRRGTTLEDEGFEDTAAGTLIESVTRHLLSAFHVFEEKGAQFEMRRYRMRLNKVERQAQIDHAGNIERVADKPARSLADTLASPSWLDPALGEPWK